jgi:predicted DCC family thiol-disulfide oxidoreductase YuxK
VADRHLVLYDGVCGLCSRLRRFLSARDPYRVFDFASLQSETGRAVVSRAGGDPDDLTSFYVVANHGSAGARVLAKSRAALFVAARLGWPWKAACVLGALPTALLDRGYDVIARNRYRVFGRLDACELEGPSEDR